MWYKANVTGDNPYKSLNLACINLAEYLTYSNGLTETTILCNGGLNTILLLVQ
jgi:hypothetical protein